MEINIKNPNALEMKSENQRTLLNILRRRSTSRADLAEQLHLTRSCITFLVDDLMERGLLRETVTKGTGVGRPPVMLEIVPEARVVGGVNIRRSSTSVGFVNLAGETLIEEEISNEGIPAEQQLCRIGEILLCQQKALAVPDEMVLGVGLCAPGPLDFRTGCLLTPPNFPGWRHVPAADILSRETGFSVYAENVSGAMALREWFFGAAREMNHFMVMQINEGIGAGVVTGGSLYRGANGLGCEIGHATIQLNGRPCACGNRGCLEAYAAIPALLKDTPFSCWEEVVSRAETDAQARALIDEEAGYLSAAIVSAINLFDLENIILMGDVAARPGRLAPLIEKTVSGCVIAHGSGPSAAISFDDRSMPVCDGAMACLYAFFVTEPQRSRLS